MAFCSPALRKAIYCLPLLALGSCSTDDRNLAFGIGTSSGSATSLGSHAGNSGSGNSNAGEGGDNEDGGDAPIVNGGARAVGGNAAASGESSSAGSLSTAGMTSAGTSSGGGSAGSTSQAGNESGGNASAAGTSSGGSTNGGNAGSGGSGGNMVDVGRCGDLDQNRVQDCDETLAHNARFDTTAQDWLADPGISASWQADDARGTSGSGELQLTYGSTGAANDWSLAAAGQCLSAWGGDSYEVGARVKLKAGQASGYAVISVAFFGNEGCKDSLLASKTVGQTAQSDSWQALHATVKMPLGTRSVLVRLGASKPGSQPSLEVHFDDVLFREK